MNAPAPVHVRKCELTLIAYGICPRDGAILRSAWGITWCTVCDDWWDHRLVRGELARLELAEMIGLKLLGYADRIAAAASRVRSMFSRRRR